MTCQARHRASKDSGRLPAATALPSAPAVDFQTVTNPIFDSSVLYVPPLLMVIAVMDSLMPASFVRHGHAGPCILMNVGYIYQNSTEQDLPLHSVQRHAQLSIPDILNS